MKSYKSIKRGAWYKDYYLIEDLYYIHTHDIDFLNYSTRKENSLYFQCVLYFRGKYL